MDIYINSTFAQSVKGYRLMKLTPDGGFDDIVSPDELPEQIFSFFSEDVFSMIWAEAPEFDANGCQSFFGLRGLQGMFCNNKAGVIDVLFRFDGESDTDEFVGRILCNFTAFCALLFSAVRVDENGDYSMSFDEFTSAVFSLEKKKMPRFVNLGSPKNGLGVLRFAVYSISQPRAKEIIEEKYFIKNEKKNLIDFNTLNKHLSLR